MDEIICRTKSASETERLGVSLSEILMAGDVVGFFGDLGSGKTCLIRGICQGLNCVDEVSSPTFTIINEYQGTYPVYHFDMYRIESPQEIYDLGFEEYFYDQGICLIEWSERAGDFLPQEHIEIYLKSHFAEGKENERSIKILPVGEKIKNRSWEKINCKQFSRTNFV